MTDLADEPMNADEISDATLMSALPDQPTALDTHGRPMSRAPQPARSRAWLASLAATALLLVSLGLGVWVVQLQREVQRQAEILAIYEAARQSWTPMGTEQA